MRLAAFFCFGFLASMYCPTPAQAQSQKGQWYAFWGWNREVYSKSDIHFSGKTYNFSLRDVDAHDKPEPLGLDPYFHPTRLTIPQTNARIGYFIGPQTSVSLGLDHMKYVMVQEQSVEVNGTIGGTGTAFDGFYDRQVVYTDKDFLQFEHTDGLNYLNAEIRQHSPLLSWHKGKYISLDITSFSGIGLGVVLPKTNVKMFGQERHDDYNLAGYGLNAVTGLGITLWEHFILQPEFKGGFINLPNIRTTKYTYDHAQQHFWFGAFNVMIGGQFRLWKEKPSKVAVPEVLP